jgi:Flp pilus assembly protein TadD
MANAVGPRIVHPDKEPGSKFIIVEKNSGPQSTDSRIMAANRALSLGHYDAAVDMFDTLYKKNPRDPRILMGRAVALQNTGRTEAALKTYDQLLTIDHNNPEALVNMLGILRKEYPEVALRRLMNLHEKYPANAMIAAQIGVTEADQGHLADAVRFLGMAVSMEPNNAQHLFNMAIVEDRAGKKDDAIKYYQQALETDAVYGDSRSVPREQIYDRLSILRQQ